MPPDHVATPLSKPALGLLLAAIFLAVMAFFFTHYDLHRDIGDNLVAGGNMEQSPLTAGGAWHVRGPRVAWEPQGGVGASGAVRLAPHAGRGSSLNYTVGQLPGAGFLRVSARVRTDAIVHGRNGWNTARVLLSFVDREDRRAPHEICELDGSTAWRLCERVIRVPNDTVAVQINVQNLAASGTLWVDDVRLIPAAEKSSAFFWRAFFAVLWCAALVYCAWLARLFDRPLGPAIVAIAIVIIAGVAAPESTIEQIVDRSADTVNGLVVAEPFAAAPSAAGSAVSRPRWTNEARRALGWPFGLVFTVKKLGHFTLFGMLAWVAVSSIARRSLASAATELATTGTALLLFAAAAEVIQFLTVSRTPSVVDWAIDAAGIVAGGGLALMWSRVAAPPIASPVP